MLKKLHVPDNVEASLKSGELSVKGPKGELKRTFLSPGINMEIKDNEIIISSTTERRKAKAIVGTWASHCRNMITGVTKGWEAKLKIVYSHFPIKFNVQGNTAIIQNFLGERKERKARIYDDVSVDVKKDEIIVTGIDKERVGQTAANIETAAKVKGFDRRVFQDGLHLIRKCSPIEENDAS